MNYLYHIVREDTKGNRLYPLNSLKKKHPDLYAKYIEKYKGREYVLKEKVLILNCLWNNTLHFSPVHPSQIKKALGDLGLNLKHRNYYQIDPFILDSKKTVIYLNRYLGEDLEKIKKDYLPYNPKGVSKYAHLPEETKKYYRRCVQKKIKPLLFHKIPHILFKGSLPISDLSIITV